MWHYLSNATCLKQASFVFNGITCLIRLIGFAALSFMVEEHLRQTSSVRQVASPDSPQTARLILVPDNSNTSIILILLLFNNIMIVIVRIIVIDLLYY